MDEFGELEYSENFVKTTQDPKFVYRAVCEVHNRESGWLVGEPIIEKIDDKDYKISIPLKKYRVEHRKF